MIDLRSDVFANPTDEMWAATRSAAPGWAFFCQDPSVNRLEALAADLPGKTVALFVPRHWIEVVACADAAAPASG